MGKQLLKTQNRLTYISNTVLIKLLVGLFLVSFGAADHIIMTRQESKLPRPVY